MFLLLAWMKTRPLGHGERQRYILPTCVVVVIATAGAEASHRQGGQIWTFTASIDGASSDAAPSLTDEQNFGVKGPAA